MTNRVDRCGTVTTWEQNCSHSVDAEYLEDLRAKVRFLLEWADETTLQLVINLMETAPD